jgi:uncharacterized RDD family membrane protein YckC
LYPIEQQPQQRPARLEYASVGWRFLAVLLDGVGLFLLFVAVVAVAAAAGAIDLQEYSTGGFDLQRTLPAWLYVAAYGVLFAYYAVTEGLFGSSPGKLLLRMRVLMDDGSRPTGTAVVVRNLVRIPEAIFYYIPSAISCAANPRRKRLGDFAARTVVVRVTGGPVPPGGGLPVTTAAAASAPPAALPGQAGGPAATTSGAPVPPDAAAALSALKQAALAVRGAHHSYLRRSEVELAGGADTGEYSPEYVAAWYTLSDAVKAMQHAYSEAIAAATSERTTVADLAAGQPDLQYLFAELQPYFTAGSDDQVHDAYLEVARSESGLTGDGGATA